MSDPVCSFYASPVLRFALRAETDTAAWSAFATPDQNPLSTTPRCTSSACAQHPNQCTPAHAIVACNKCVRNFTRCDLVLVFIRGIIKDTTAWKSKKVDEFMEIYATQHSAAIDEVMNNPLSTTTDAFTSGRWYMVTSIENLKSVKKLDMGDKDNLEKGLEGMGRLAFRSVISQVVLCLKLAHLSYHVSNAQRAWSERHERSNTSRRSTFNSPMLFGSLSSTALIMEPEQDRDVDIVE
ncbi:hypothetical protein BKA70DRAFT_1232381 [Coprinopsis sp. MPI-PUGE-AT-0042]|nr:hypothetical protein BKA70DRAFT_1232381 [Coprinopsis sp. MPI-PUGE-AT-0042]